MKWRDFIETILPLVSKEKYGNVSVFFTRIEREKIDAKNLLAFHNF